MHKISASEKDTKHARTHCLCCVFILLLWLFCRCGKTTQIPQFILDASLSRSKEQVANIICTQPRRISAMSVAQRVAQERAECLGNSVGYQIRLESVRVWMHATEKHVEHSILSHWFLYTDYSFYQTSATRLLYCTTGVLLRRLEGEADLKGVTHVIVDEVHERTEERWDRKGL